MTDDFPYRRLSEATRAEFARQDAFHRDMRMFLLHERAFRESEMTDKRVRWPERQAER